MLLFVVLTVVACGSDSTSVDSPAATSAAGPTAAAGSAPPTGTAGGRTQWGPVSIQLPSGFTPVDVPAGGNGQRYGARASTSSDPAGTAAVAVVVQDTPQRSAREEVAANAKIARQLGGESVVSRQVSLPGADDVWTLEYDEPAQPPLHRASVVADLGDRIVVVEGRAPATRYDATGLPAALSSLRFTP